MEDTIQLGGNIELNGISKLNGGEIVILKKMVGTYTKKISESKENFEKLSINFNKDDSKYKIKCQVSINGKNYTAEAKNSNLFFTINEVFTQIEKELI